VIGGDAAEQPGSSMKARKKSTLCTMALPGGTRTTAASSGACRPIRMSSRSIGCTLASARDSTVAPTLAPQPPQRMAMAEMACACSGSVSGISSSPDFAAAGIGSEPGELVHEAAVDRVLPAPDPVAARVEGAARGDAHAGRRC
jgi:hypothetical protein